MDETHYAFWLTVAGSICWVVCFWWMHRISNKQNTLLDQLREQGKRIEKLSRIEHDLIKDVHPQVAEIKKGIDAMGSIPQWTLGTHTHCPLCWTPVLAPKGCTKHRDARKLMGSHRLRVAVAVLFKNHFRCPYCNDCREIPDLAFVAPIRSCHGGRSVPVLGQTGEQTVLDIDGIAGIFF